MSPGVPIRLETATLKEIRQVSDWPTQRCYVIQFLETRHIHHEGDERSRTAPGHGYPAYTETIHVVRQFATVREEEWRSTIESLYVAVPGRNDLVAFMADPATIRRRIAVEIL